MAQRGQTFWCGKWEVNPSYVSGLRWKPDGSFDPEATIWPTPDDAFEDLKRRAEGLRPPERALAIREARFWRVALMEVER